MSHRLGPNTQLAAGVVRENVILCAGEDASELHAAFAALKQRPPDLLWEYRCYRFWNVEPATTLVWTGIGTGCLEPLLCELLHADSPVRSLLLIGTAGRLREGRVEFGQAYPVGEALVGPSAIRYLTGGESIQRPRFAGFPTDEPIRSVSTDLYFLEEQDAAQFRCDCDLIDMEVAQFYYLCARLSAASGRDLDYLAVKGPANDLGCGEQQGQNSPAVLEACLRQALERLHGTSLAAPSDAPRRSG